MIHFNISYPDNITESCLDAKKIFMMPHINENISVIICSKDSLEDVKYHLKNVDSYQVGEIIFVTSCLDEIDAVKQNLGKYQTSISLVIDKGTGVGQARAKAFAPNLEIEEVGIRPGEKLHEVMCPSDDSHLTLEFEDHFLIEPTINFFDNSFDYQTNQLGEKGKYVDYGFEYNSGSNPVFLSPQEILDYGE